MFSNDSPLHYEVWTMCNSVFYFENWKKKKKKRERMIKMIVFLPNNGLWNCFNWQLTCAYLHVLPSLTWSMVHDLELVTAVSTCHRLGEANSSHFGRWLRCCQLWGLSFRQKCYCNVFCTQRWTWGSSSVCPWKRNTCNIRCHGFSAPSIPKQGLWCCALCTL